MTARFPTKFWLVVLSLFHPGSCIPSRAIPGLSYLPPSPGNTIKETSITIGSPAFTPPGEVPVLDDTPGSGVIPFPPPSPEISGDFPESPEFKPLPILPFEGCPEACTKIYDPVCGTDGVTYNNKCLFEIALCKGSSSGLTLSVAFGGPCGSSLSPSDSGILDSVDLRVPHVPPTDTSSTTVCKEECTKIYQPVCGTDSVTYSNLCTLELASCRNVNNGGYAIEVDYEGPCVTRDTAVFVSAMTPRPASDTSFSAFTGNAEGPQEGSPLSSCPEACTKIFAPVCGSDDQTYNNECLLNVASCKGRSAGLEAVFKVFEGPCVAVLPRGPACDESCDKTFIPVCGSDGETYNNICLLNLSDCLNPFASITYVSNGPCESSAPPRLSSDPRPSISTEPRPDIEITGALGGGVVNDLHSQPPSQGYLTPV